MAGHPVLADAVAVLLPSAGRVATNGSTGWVRATREVLASLPRA